MKRIGAGENLGGVGETYSVGVRTVRVGAVAEDFVPVGEAIAVRVGVRIDAVSSCILGLGCYTLLFATVQ